MDAEEYIATVQEQLRAYDFTEVGADAPYARPSYHRSVSGRLRSRDERVALVKLDESTVESVKDAIDNAAKTFVNASESNSRLDRRWWYVLLVPLTVNRPMITAAERAAGSIEDYGLSGQLLPVLCDLEEGRLEYADASGAQNITGYRKLANNVGNYFRL